MAGVRHENPSAAVLYHREWRSKNWEKVLAQSRARYAKNRDALLAKARERHVKNREKVREVNRLWRKKNPGLYRKYYLKDPAAVLFRLARSRAKKRGLNFDLTVDDIVIPTHCPVLGTPMTVGCGFGFRSTAPTIDRIDNSKGYVKGNVSVISWRANRIKSDSSLAELRQLVTFLEGWRA